jgi:superfamily II DNA/RNA helicase
MYFRNKKIELFKDLITDDSYFGKNKKIVVWCSHTAEILKIEETVKNLGFGCVTFYGSKSKEKNLARKEFRDNHKIRFFAGQVDAGVGMNELVVANVGMYYSNSFKVISKVQSKKRIRRIGSERHKHITYCEMVTEKSIDLHILSCLKRNIDIADFIMRKIKQHNKIGDILK